MTKKHSPPETGSTHRLFFFNAPNDRNSINLGIGEPGFEASENIKKAAVEHILGKENGYPHPKGMPKLREKLAEKISKKNKFNAPPESIMVTNGAKMGIFLSIMTLAGKGDEVLVPSPTWDPFISIVKRAGATPVFYDFSISSDLSEFEDKFTKKTKAIVLNSPNNPSGRVVKPKELENIAKVVSDSGAVLISDEAYEDIIFDDNKHVSPATLIPEKTITAYSFSKTYCMTGWRAGYLTAQKNILEPMLALQTEITAGVPAFVQSAMLSALDEKPDGLEARLKRYRENRETVCSALDGLLEFKKPQGTFYLLANVSGTGHDGLEFVQKMSERGVLCIPGFLFGEDFKDYVRFTFTKEPVAISAAMKKIREFIEDETNKV